MIEVKLKYLESTKGHPDFEVFCSSFLHLLYQGLFYFTQKSL